MSSNLHGKSFGVVTKKAVETSGMQFMRLAQMRYHLGCQNTAVNRDILRDILIVLLASRDTHYYLSALDVEAYLLPIVI